MPTVENTTVATVHPVLVMVFAAAERNQNKTDSAPE
jgi:hypothetical protein